MSTARLDWYGCATFRLVTAEGLTVMLDAYLDRVPEAAQSGVGVADVAAGMGPGDWVLVHMGFALQTMTEAEAADALAALSAERDAEASTQ